MDEETKEDDAETAQASLAADPPPAVVAAAQAVGIQSQEARIGWHRSISSWISGFLNRRRRPK